MKLNKLFTLKASVIAVAAVVAGNAFAAAVDLDAASPVSIKYVSEKTISAATLLEDGAAADQTATVTLGANFATNAVAYVRVDLTGGVFTGAPSFAVTGSTGAATTSIAQGGDGQSFVIFAVAPQAGENLVGANAAVIDTDTAATLRGITVTAQGNVTMTYKLFETLTNAANSTLPLKTVSNVNYIQFAAATATAATAGTSPTADVAATTAYTAFVTGSGAPGGTATKALGSVQTTFTARALPSGAAAVVGDVLAGTNAVSVTGDFSLAKNEAGTYTGGALNRVFLNANADCTTGAPTIAASTLTASTATFATVTAAQLVTGLNLCVTAGDGAGANSNPILASGYTGSVDLVPQTGFAVTDVSLALAAITRNGGQVDVRSYIPAGTVGYTSFVRVINTGGSSTQVSGQWLYEDGTVSTAVALGSPVASGGAVTWASSTIEAAIGAPTATIGNNRPRLRLTAPTTGLQAQSFFLNPDNSFATMHGAD